MSKSTLGLPDTVDELTAILNDNSALKAWNEAGEFGELLSRGIELKAEAMQADQAEAARNGGGLKRLDLRNSASVASLLRPATHPLAYTAEALNAVQAGIDTRTSLRSEHDMSPERWQVLNATLTTTERGAPREWGASVLPGPRMLHVSAGVRTVPSDAVDAEFSKLALPSATAASAEGATLAEYDDSTAGTVTLGRYGRFTDMSVESRFGTDATAIVAMHTLGIAKDLDDVLITAVENDAGTPVAFDADVPAAIRKAIAILVDATAADDPGDVFVLVHTDDVALLEDVTPTGGRTIGEQFQTFSGGRVYASAAVQSGFITVANIKAGVLFFEARAAMTEVDSDIKSGVETVATSIIGGFGSGAIGDYSIQVDVVE